jgi:hypothetical protein
MWGLVGFAGSMVLNVCGDIVEAKNVSFDGWSLVVVHFL